MKRLFIYSIGIIFFLSASSCNRLIDTFTNNSTEYKLNLPKLPMNATLDPSRTEFTSEYIFLNNVTINLVEVGKSGEYELLLAKKIEISDDKKHVTISLKDASFSDGSSITATDVAQTIKRLIVVGSPYSDPDLFIVGGTKLKDINDKIPGIEVLDKKTIRLNLVAPTKELFYYLQLADYGILHPLQYNKNHLTVEDWTKVSSGPYRFDKQGTLLANLSALNAHSKMVKKFYNNRRDGQQLISAIKTRSVDAGDMSFSQYRDNFKKLESIPNIGIFGGPDSILNLTLNVKNKIFRSLKNRQWFYRKIFENLNFPKSESKHTLKANQFLAPGMNGIVSTEEIQNLIKTFPTKTPRDLMQGITISTLTTMPKYMPARLEDRLSNALGIPVKINANIPRDNIVQLLKNRNFEVFAISTSIDYKLVGESLNSAYTSKHPKLLDATKKIIPMIRKYKQLDDPTKEAATLKMISKEMIFASELIPLAYLTSPSFFDLEKFDITKLNLNESFQLWRLQVK